MYLMLCIIVTHTYSKSMDQPGKVANPARGQLNRENVPSRVSPLISILRLNLVLTDFLPSSAAAYSMVTENIAAVVCLNTYNINGSSFYRPSEHPPVPQGEKNVKIFIQHITV